MTLAPGRWPLCTRLIVAWFVLVTPPALFLAFTLPGAAATHEQADLFFREEDGWVLAALSAAILLSPLVWKPAWAAPRWKAAPARAIVLVTAGLVTVVSFAGAALLFADYALSRDEDMAAFGATILRHGQLWAPVAPTWRAYVAGLEPEFVRFSSGGAFWQPAYLPMNAALQALAEPLASLVNPILAGFSVVAVWAVGRRLWPGRPGLALVAAILLATSSQLLLTAMTPYAMTAHLAFNLGWLWLYLRGGRAGHAGALIVGFLACGIHQLAFHPLFAAPLVLQLWLDRRWRLAALYTLAYAAICVFWLELSPLDLSAVGGTGAAGGVAGLPGQVSRLIDAHHPPTFRSMAENFIRFITWQNVLTAPLVLIGAWPALKAGGVARMLVVGIVLTAGFMFVIMPYQGYGWGYRYWHGLLGSMTLVAALGWARIVDRLRVTDRHAARVVLAGAAAVSVLILFPVRVVQAALFVGPYAQAHAAIAASPNQLVLVEPRGGWYANDLVRNDPYLRNRPLVLRAPALTRGQIAVLCSLYTVSVFDPGDGARFGIRTDPGRGGGAGFGHWRTLGLSPRCGPNSTPVVEILPGGPRPVVAAPGRHDVAPS